MWKDEVKAGRSLESFQMRSCGIFVRICANLVCNLQQFDELQRVGGHQGVTRTRNLKTENGMRSNLTRLVENLPNPGVGLSCRSWYDIHPAIRRFSSWSKSSLTEAQNESVSERSMRASRKTSPPFITSHVVLCVQSWGSCGLIYPLVYRMQPVQLRSLLLYLCIP